MNIQPGVNLKIIALVCIGLFAGVCLAENMRGGMTEKNLIVNGDFEKGGENWHPLWTREPGAGKTAFDTGKRHGGTQSIRIEHTGDKDWSLSHVEQLNVMPGEIYELSAWVCVKGKGTATLGVVTRDANGKVLEWEYGGKSESETKGWFQLRTRFVIPRGASTIQTRLTGGGSATVWLDDVVLKIQGNLNSLRNKNLPVTQTIRNDTLEVTFHTDGAEFEMKDRRTNRTWVQKSGGDSPIVLDAVVKQD